MSNSNQTELSVITPTFSRFLDEREAHRHLAMPVGLVDMCGGKHVNALVLQGLLDNLAEARRGRRAWLLDETGRIFVEATYDHWWWTLRLRRKATHRALQALEVMQGLVTRQTFKRRFQTEGGPAGVRALHVCLDEARFGAAWEKMLREMKNT